MSARLRLALLVLAVVLGAGLACAGAPRAAHVRGLQPDWAEGELSVTWIGHATALVKIGPQVVLTDPSLGGTLFIVPRDTEPAVRAEDLPPIDVALVSHLHWDHFDRGTLGKLRPTMTVVLPPGSEGYTTGLRQTRRETLAAWERTQVGGLTITSVPASHFGGRYGFDALVNESYAGYVIEGHGRRLFFAGDTGYHPELFREIGRRFPGIELALVPIAPYRPGRIGSPVHATPIEALAIFRDLGAEHMIPIHYEHYFTQFGGGYDRPRTELERAIAQEGLQGRVHALRTGELWRPAGASVAAR